MDLAQENHTGDDGDPGETRDLKGRAKEKMLTPRASHLYDDSQLSREVHEFSLLPLQHGVYALTVPFPIPFP